MELTAGHSCTWALRANKEQTGHDEEAEIRASPTRRRGCSVIETTHQVAEENFLLLLCGGGVSISSHLGARVAQATLGTGTRRKDSCIRESWAWGPWFVVF